MINKNLPTSAADRLIVRGIHLELTPALRNAVTEKSARLFRHQEHIVRLRIDIEHDQSKAVDFRFIAKGHIEIGGPDLLASVASDDAYKSLDLLVDKLDNLLRRRASEYKGRRHEHATAEVIAEGPPAG